MTTRVKGMVRRQDFVIWPSPKFPAKMIALPFGYNKSRGDACATPTDSFKIVPLYSALFVIYLGGKILFL